MERIGIAASKIAQGNLFLYNICVIVISFLFSLFIFFISIAIKYTVTLNTNYHLHNIAASSMITPLPALIRTPP